MADITTVWDVPLSRGDWVQQGAVLQSGGDVVTATLLSLFTDRVANADDDIPDGTSDPRGWWADEGKYPIGSRLWLLSREKQVDRVPLLAQDYCREALQWMLDDGVVSSFDISAEWVRASLLGVQVIAHRTGAAPVSLRFSAAWNLSGVTFTVGDPGLN
jgi:phage gp46-like protein